MAAPKKTLETNPELAFVDVDLLDLYRRLKPLDGWSRTQKATAMDFVARVKVGDPLPQPPQQSQARKILRALLDLEAAPPPKKRGTVAAGASGALSRVRSFGQAKQRKSAAAQQVLEAA